MSFKAQAIGAAAHVVRAAESMVRLGRGCEPEQVQSVLFLEYRLPLGCCVHLTPVYEAIKRSRPEVVISVATRGDGATLLRHHPFVDHLIETPDVLVDTLGAAAALRKELKRRGIRPDCILTGASDRRSRIATLGLLAGSGWRGGYTLVPALYHRPLAYDRRHSLIDNNLRLAELAGCSQEHREPSVYFSEEDTAWSKQLVQEANPGNKPLLVMVTQASGGQRTGWHASRFAEVVRHATRKLGFAVVYVGTNRDAMGVQEIRGLAGGVGTSLAGRTTVTELAALLAMSDAMISLDTGTMHLGRAVGVPMVVIGPSWQKTTEWMPLGLKQAKILRGPDRTDVPQDYRLDEVEAPQVIEALEEMLAAHPASRRSRDERVQRGMTRVDHVAKAARPFYSQPQRLATRSAH